jgi:hypothetical protein
MATEKKITAAEIKATAKANVLAELSSKLEELGAEMVGNVAYIPQTVGEQEVWVEVKLTTKQYTDTSVSKAFDPFVARENYESEQAVKAAEAEAKAKAKADKAKSKKSRSRKANVEVEG